MLCSECGKNNATVHYTQIVNGHKTESHLCEECAKKHKTLFNNNLYNNFSMENFFSGMLNNAFGGYLSGGKGCEKCGTTFEQFRQMGKFGCSDCIDTFKQRLLPVIRNIQGYDTHRGKIPKKAEGRYKVEKEIEKLKSELKQYIEQEEYEKAAETRDKIRAIENGIQQE